MQTLAHISPVTVKLMARLILGSVFTWHSYLPESSSFVPRNRKPQKFLLLPECTASKRLSAENVCAADVKICRSFVRIQDTWGLHLIDSGKKQHFEAALFESVCCSRSCAGAPYIHLNAVTLNTPLPEPFTQFCSFCLPTPEKFAYLKAYHFAPMAHDTASTRTSNREYNKKKMLLRGSRVCADSNVTQVNL